MKLRLEGEVLLQLKGVCAGYGKIGVLHDIDLTVRTGEIVTLLGANGAGKTTTLLCTSGLKPVTAGTITFRGEDITELPAHRITALGLAQVPEGRKIFPRLTVTENLDLGAYLRNDKTAVETDRDYVYSLFPILRERRHQAGGTLSGGEQQMLAIGRALMSRPSMLLMDEPSMGIAPLLVQKIFETIKALNKEGLTILLVEQNAHAALELAERGYVLETGRILLEDYAPALLRNDNVRKAYLGEE